MRKTVGEGNSQQAFEFAALKLDVRWDRCHEFDDRVVKALTVRVLLSVVLFAMLMLGFYFGIITDKL